MKRKLIKWSLISLTISFVLFMALGVHLYYVTDNFYQHKTDAPQLQLARIDFKEDIDSVRAEELKSIVNKMPGVQKSYFNVEDNILVYSYYVGSQNSQFVFASLNNAVDINAERFVVSEKDKYSGCPAMSSNGETKGLLHVYQVIFSIF